jgi:hypothetical protein
MAHVIKASFTIRFFEHENSIKLIQELFGGLQATHL